MSAKARVRRTNFMLDIALFIICILLLTPLILLIANGFKTPQEMLVWPPTLFPKDPTLQNFQKVFTETPLLRWMFNSFAFVHVGHHDNNSRPPIELPALAEKCCHGEDAFPTSAVFATYGV